MRPITLLSRGETRDCLLLHRAPCLDSPEQVVDWLLARGCTQIEVHRGPDGSYRGSGIARGGKPE